jgi:hypothetical protein
MGALAWCTRPSSARPGRWSPSRRFCRTSGKKWFNFFSVADPGCLSWILILTHPGSINSYKREGRKKLVVIYLYVATNFTKCKIILFLNCRRKKFRPNFKELNNFLPKKLLLSSQKYEFGIRDPGFRINLFRIPDPGVKKALDPGSGSAAQNFLFILFRNCTSCQLAVDRPLSLPRGSRIQ